MVLPQPGPTRLRDYPAFSRFVTRFIDWPVLGFDSPKKTVLYSTVPGSLVYYTDMNMDRHRQRQETLDLAGLRTFSRRKKLLI